MTVQEVLFMMADEGAYFHFDEKGGMSIRCEPGRKLGGFLRGMMMIHKADIKKEVLRLKAETEKTMQMGVVLNIRPPVWSDRATGSPPGIGSSCPPSTETPSGEVTT